MWFKRIIYSLLGIRSKHDFEKDIKQLSIIRIILLFILINITFIGLIFLITRFFIN
ncbi:DUF2970 domain-containing protein [Gammaproteobacteria bacterium]|nr:DUF2970 domain-containing protein [Gammaproteobacteria bacterium]MDC1150627.1 DUF2970 domain-containing protein [Gammaproteobacteria bacterium]